MVSESVYQDVTCGFHLLEDILWWGTSGMAGRCLGLIGQPMAEQAADQNKGPVSQRQKTGVLFLQTDVRKGYVWTRLSSSLVVCSYIHADPLHFL